MTKRAVDIAIVGLIAGVFAFLFSTVLVPLDYNCAIASSGNDVRQNNPVCRQSIQLVTGVIVDAGADAKYENTTTPPMYEYAGRCAWNGGTQTIMCYRDGGTGGGKWEDIGGGLNNWIENGDGDLLAQGDEMLGLGNKADPDPAAPSGGGTNGFMYYNSTLHQIRAYINGAWTTLALGSALAWDNNSGFVDLTDGTTERVMVGVGSIQTAKLYVAFNPTAEPTLTAGATIHNTLGNSIIPTLRLEGTLASSDSGSALTFWGTSSRGDITGQIRGTFRSGLQFRAEDGTEDLAAYHWRIMPRDNAVGPAARIYAFAPQANNTYDLGYVGVYIRNAHVYGIIPQGTGTVGTSAQVLHGGASASWSAVAMGSDVSGTLPVPNGGTGITTVCTDCLVSGNGAGAVTAESDVTVTTTTLRIDDHHITSEQTTAPTTDLTGTTLNDGAGAGATCVVTAGGTDTAGHVTITAGNGTPGAGLACLIVFNVAYATAPKSVQMECADADCADREKYVSARLTTSFSIAFNQALATSEVVELTWLVVE